MDDPETMMKKCVTNVCKPGRDLLVSGYVRHVNANLCGQ